MSDRVVVSQYGLRVLVDMDDPDRKPKPPVVYTLSQEEIEARYGHIKGSGKKPIPLDTPEEVSIRNSKGEDDCMKKLDIDVEVLKSICREHGTGIEGARKVAETLKLTEKQAENQIYLKKIKRLLEQEGKEMIQKGIDEQKHEHLDEKPIKSSKVKSAVTVKEPKKVSKDAEGRRSVLRPTQWKGNGRIYSFRDDALVIEFDGGAIDELVVENLDELINELQEIKAMREAG